MERKVLVAASVLGFLGLLSVILGFAAEGERVKMSDVSMDRKRGTCYYPGSPAFGLGFASAVVLLVAHMTMNCLTGCICCRRSIPFSASRFHWMLPPVSFILFWFTFVMTFLLLLGGAFLNNRYSSSYMYLDYNNCYVIKSGIFAGAALLALISVSLGILAYLTLIPQQKNNHPVSPGLPNQTEIAMGQAQTPPASHDPVFVHEDTYIRRQFT